MDEEDNDCDIIQNVEDKPNDISLLAEGEVIEANKDVLSQSSAYFNAMFRSNMKETFSTQISIHDVPASVLRALVQYAYDKSIELNISSVYDILNGACMLQFSGVINICINYLTENLSVANCLNVMFNAGRNGLQKLYFRAKRRALWHFPEVRLEPAFRQLPLEGVREYLANDMLRIDTEREVLEAVYGWVMYNSNERLTMLPSTLEVVRLGLMREEELRLALKDEFVLMSPEATAILNDVLLCKTGRTELLDTLPENCFKERHINKEIWLIGGELLYPDRKAPHCKIALFDDKDKQLHNIYEKLPPLVGHEREYLGYRSCLVGKDVYLCGGEITMGRNCWQLNVWMFDTFEESWEVVSQLPQPRRHLALVAMETDLYLIGGFGRHRIMLDSVEKYDTVTGDWSTVPSLNRAVYSAAACRHGNRIYVVKHDVESYSPGDNTWTKITMPLPFEIGIQTCVSLDSNIYLVGSYIKDLIQLDTETLKLTKLGTFQDACGPAVLVDGVIYVLGGEEAETIESYNIQQAKFKVECRLKVPLMCHSGAVVPCYPGYGKGAETARPP